MTIKIISPRGGDYKCIPPHLILDCVTWAKKVLKLKISPPEKNFRLSEAMNSPT